MTIRTASEAPGSRRGGGRTAALVAALALALAPRVAAAQGVLLELRPRANDTLRRPSLGRLRVEVGDDVVGDRVRDREVEQDPAGAQDQEAVAGLLDVGDDVGRQEGGRPVGADAVDQDVQKLPASQRIQARHASLSVGRVRKSGRGHGARRSGTGTDDRTAR